MNRGKLNLIMTFHVYTDGAPAETEVEDSLVLSVPVLNSKYVQLPKVIEGVTERIVETHNRKVNAWELQEEKEEAERRRRPRLWDSPSSDEEEVDTVITDTISGIATPQEVTP